MRELFTNKYFILLLVITILLLVITALYTADRKSVTYGEDLVGAIITPFQALFTSATEGIRNFSGYFSDIKELREKNKEMAEQINELSNTVRKLEQYKLENERLRGMLALKDTMEDYGLVAAEVIAKDSGNWFNSFTINKGSADNLAVRQAVITSGGLVGHIYEIGTNWAKVISIIDANSSVGAVIARTRDIAVVESDVELQNQGLCKMTYIGKNVSIMSGDIAETSGLGGIYPKGILIGKVREIRPETAGISQYAILEPAVDFERISTVFVITRYPEE